jgi:hypothetical protein
MNLEENQETQLLLSLVRTIRAPTVSEGVQSLLAGDDSARAALSEWEN